jgi:hypothetical protein
MTTSKNTNTTTVFPLPTPARVGHPPSCSPTTSPTFVAGSHLDIKMSSSSSVHLIDSIWSQIGALRHSNSSPAILRRAMPYRPWLRPMPPASTRLGIHIGHLRPPPHMPTLSVCACAREVEHEVRLRACVSTWIHKVKSEIKETLHARLSMMKLLVNCWSAIT